MAVVARKLRIQYEGAIYHVINRGSYRRDIFGSAGAAQGSGERGQALGFGVDVGS
jgi:hypothetical protein